MIPLGIRLSLNGGKESLLRLLGIAGGVMVGVVLLLFMISGLKLLNGTLDKACWECTGQTYISVKGNATTDPLHWHKRDIAFNAKSILVYEIAKTGPNAPHIPGVTAVPGPGEFYVSPALAKLLQETPDDQLDDRFPYKLVGQIGRAGVTYPRDLVAIVGSTPEKMPLTPDLEAFWASPRFGPNDFTYLVWEVNDKPRPRTFDPFASTMFTVIASGLLASVVTLVATTTRLSASRREQRFAAMRLFGATPRQINQLAATEAALGAGAGALLGVGLFYLIRLPLAAGISSLDVVSFFAEDLQPGIFSLLGVIVGAPLLAAGAAIISLRKVRISPLGVMRKTTPKPPGSLRLVMPVVGLLVMTWVWWQNRGLKDPAVMNERLPYFMAGFVLLVLGIAVAGPWLTMVLTKIAAKRVRTASGLLAFRRLADNPKGAFRSVNILVIAAFLAALVAALSPLFLDSFRPQINASKKEGPILLDGYFLEGDGAGVPIQASQPTMDKLLRIPGVYPVVGYNPNPGVAQELSSILVRCNELPALGLQPCPPDKTAVKLPSWFGVVSDMTGSTGTIEYIQAPETLSQHRVIKLIIAIRGGQANVERVRTALASQQLVSGSSYPTSPEMRQRELKIIRTAYYFVYGVFLIILCIASCSLAVSVAGSLVERKRPFGLLRVTGTSLGQLRKVVIIESLVPLLTAVAVSIGLGLLTAVLMAESFSDKESPNVAWLPPEFYLVVAAGVGLAMLVTLATMPLLANLTKPENSRFE